MADYLTRLGARQVTSDIDRLASLVQSRFDFLGLPSEKIARDFALWCDNVSDCIEKKAVANEKLYASDESQQQDPDPDPKSDDQNKPEHYYSKGKGKSAEGEKAADFDPSEIAKPEGGPLQQQSDEPYMSGQFTEQEHSELSQRQESGALASPDKFAESMARLSKMAMSDTYSQLSGLKYDLQMAHAKLEGAHKGVAGDLKKQIAAVAKLCDGLVKLEATGEGDAGLYLGAEKAVQAITEQMGYLGTLMAGADEGSPTALMEFEALVGDGSIQKLVALATKIVEDAAKSKGGKKAVQVSLQAADATAAKADDDDDDDDKGDDEDSDDDSDDDDDDEDGDDEDDKDAGKKASWGHSFNADNDFGYSLSATA